MKISHILVGILFSLTLFTGTEAAAQSCTSLVKQQFDFMKLGGRRTIIINGVSVSQALSTQTPVISAFGGGMDTYTPEYYVTIPNGVTLRMPAKLTSPVPLEVNQFFNDRTYLSYQYGLWETQYFSAFAGDKVQFVLDDTGVITVTLNTWSNIRHSITSVTCSGNVMTGYVTGTSLLYVFTFVPFNGTI